MNFFSRVFFNFKAYLTTVFIIKMKYNFYLHMSCLFKLYTFALIYFITRIDKSRNLKICVPPGRKPVLYIRAQFFSELLLIHLATTPEGLLVNVFCKYFHNLSVKQQSDKVCIYFPGVPQTQDEQWRAAR